MELKASIGAVSAHCHPLLVTNPRNMEEEIQSEVEIKNSGKGYIIKVSDQFTSNVLAVTAEELMQIVTIGNQIIK